MGNMGLIRAIQFFGSQQKLANALKVDRRVVNDWLNKAINLPVQHAILIEALSNEKILAEELAPYAKNQILIYKKYILNKNIR